MTEKKEKIFFTKKSLARLIACQALSTYFDENNKEEDINKILSNINTYYVMDEFTNDKNENSFKTVFKNSFVLQLVNFVIDNTAKLDEFITKFLNKEEPFGTLDPVVVQILRTAIAESTLSPELDKKIIINEYVDIAAEFYADITPTFVNGMLDSIFFGKKEKEQKAKKLEHQSNVKIKHKTI